MFTIHEIETENKLSVFPRFYAALASSIRSVCGDRGEGAVRQAIRLYAARQAGALCSAHKAAGVKQNVKSYQCAGDCMISSSAKKSASRRSIHVPLSKSGGRTARAMWADGTVRNMKRPSLRPIRTVSASCICLSC